ncbi:hypothetical protein Nepgr_029259 [Nepenthes gracilis]|uniref:Uncharacterized protein n=1 Tax=Nepenthes gracilis TaxID=150966 RepID=A0AAD3TDU5_NEPGR|nr:hypothetical protein Nepgr_029259 [Nepenthes gracilis]
MKINKGKGKVHPSPSPSTSAPSLSSCSDISKYPNSALKLLPAAILALITVLSLEDREVLEYMITRSIKSTENPSSLLEENKRRKNKHNPPLFDCGCFDCYTSYWFRWDSSPNRELIHQAIEAFEEHLAAVEQSKTNNNRGERDRLGGRRRIEISQVSADVERPTENLNADEKSGAEEDSGEQQGLTETAMDEVTPPYQEDEVEVIIRMAGGGSNHKGLARKVLPDVIGLLNSRLWSLWSPNV